MKAHRFLSVTWIGIATLAVTPTAFAFRLFDANGAFGYTYNKRTLDCGDLDQLTVAIVTSSFGPVCDLNGDGWIDVVDRDRWLAAAGAMHFPSGNPVRPGDANLDGVVDGSDFNIWNANKFTNSSSWCRGDFNTDGVVDGSDFNVWNANKFTSADGVVLTPEPLPGWIGVALLLFLRRRGKPAGSAKAVC